MRVNIDEIKEDGLRRSWDLTGEAVDEMVSGDRAGYRAQGPMHVEGRLSKLDRRVVFEGQARARLQAPCSRCLGGVTVEVPVAYRLDYVPEDEVMGRGSMRDHEDDDGRHDGRPRGTFRTDEVNEETYQGKVIDLDPMLREQLLLALPGYPVCRDDCKGLCTVCGTNLNERDCGCDRRVPDPRWAGLQTLKQKSKEE
jgi:uncharacterized protein